jgi:hypothetical protein
MDFYENLYVIVFKRSKKNNGYFTWRHMYFFIVFNWILHRMRNEADEICRENQNTIYAQFFVVKSCHLWHNVAKCSRARQDTDDDITQLIWNAYCFSMVTMVMRMCHGVTLHYIVSLVTVFRMQSCIGLVSHMLNTAGNLNTCLCSPFVTLSLPCFLHMEFFKLVIYLSDVIMINV